MEDRARRWALTAVGLDCTWITALVILWPSHWVAGAIGAGVVAGGLLAVRVRAIGYALIPVRGFAALIMLAVAATALLLLLLALAATVSAFQGFAAARAAGKARRAQRLGPPRTRSKRFDDVGSAIILFGFVALMVAALLAQRRFEAAGGFVVYWIVLSWGTIAIHEAGHAFAARHTDNDVPQVSIGTGLTLFHVGRVRVGAIGFVGHTHWAANESTMTSRREAYIVLAGPAANLAAAFVLLSIPVVRGDALGLALVGVNVATALLNLVPLEYGGMGPRMMSDGARALRLLRRTQPVADETRG